MTDQAHLIIIGNGMAGCHAVDPARTETAERADLHHAIAPDNDIALWTGLLRELRTALRFDGGSMAQRVSVPRDFWSTLPNAVRQGVDLHVA